MYTHKLDPPASYEEGDIIGIYQPSNENADLQIAFVDSEDTSCAASNSETNNLSKYWKHQRRNTIYCYSDSTPVNDTVYRFESCHRAISASEGHLYAYGGSDGTTRYAVLSKLDVSTFNWSLLSPQDPSVGPMRKWECGLVCFHGCMLTLFGGYGIPNDPIQSGSEFIQDECYWQYKQKVGWTNKLHAFDIRKGIIIIIDSFTSMCIYFTCIGHHVWFSPSVRGTRPPPIRNFTFTSINKCQALLYVGYLPEGKLRVSELYIFDFSDSETMVCYIICSFFGHLSKEHLPL